MGVSCVLTLPAAARIEDVADVMAALAGFPMQKLYFHNDPKGGWSAGHKYPHPYLTVKPCGDTFCLPACANITITAPEGEELADGERAHFVMYHFEGGAKGERLMLPPSTPFWIAVMRGVIDFFGGTLAYDDCDDKISYRKSARKDIHASDGEQWYQLQKRKLAVNPITQAQYDFAFPLAAYPRAAKAKLFAEAAK